MRKLSKLVSLVLAVVLCVGMASPALAVQYNVAEGVVHVKNDSTKGTYSYQTKAEGNTTNVYTSEDKEGIIITGNYKDTTYNSSGGCVVDVGENVKDTIILRDVTIDVGQTGNYESAGKAALSIDKGSDVTVQLEGSNTLKSGYERAGLELKNGASVTVLSGEDKEGSLNVTGGSWGSGIGSGAQYYGSGYDKYASNGAYKGKAGNITITGKNTTVTATSRDYNAGIGGEAGNITITDGAKVTATGWSAGIGSRSNKAVGDITISCGAQVTATGGGGGAGIGSGRGGHAGNITITGAGTTVTATGGYGGAGIGSGSSASLDYKSSVGDITITDCESVTAIGGGQSYDTSAAAGIGAGGGEVYVRYDKKEFITMSTTGKITVKGNKNLTVKSGGEGAATIGGVETFSEIDEVNVTHLDEAGELLYIHEPKNGERTEFTATPPANGTEKITVNEDGNTIQLPSGTAVKDAGSNETTYYPDGATLGQDGKPAEGSATITQGEDGTVTFKDGEGKTTTPDVPEDKKGDVKVNVSEDGTVTVDVPAGTAVAGNGETTYYPDGATLDKDGKPIGNSATITQGEDGGVTFKDSEGKATTPDVPEEKKDEVEINVGEDGTVTVDVPTGTVVTGKDGGETTYPQGATLDEDGNPTGDAPSVTKDKDGNVTIQDKDGNATKAEVPGDKKDEVEVKADEDGKVTVEVPAGTVVTNPDGSTTELPYGGTIGADGSVTSNPNPSEDVPGTPTVPDSGASEFIPASGASGTTAIENQEVPLAGLVSRGALIAYLYVHEGSPDGEDAEGEYTKAMAWAAANDIADGDADPEEIVTAAMLRDVLTRYARFLDAAFTLEIPGEDDALVMNCDEILEKFFEDLEKQAA